MPVARSLKTVPRSSGFGAPEGLAWKSRPLRFGGSSNAAIFRHGGPNARWDEGRISLEMAVEI